MKSNLQFFCILLALASGLSACNKDSVHIMNPGNFTDTTGTLKDAAAKIGFPIGIGIDYDNFMNNAVYRSTVAANADQVTFGYEMKEGAIQKNDGSLDFTNADALYNAATTAGLGVYGHNLCWYQNQNAQYLTSIVGSGSGTTASNLITNGDFETWNGASPAGWGLYNQNNGGISQSADAHNIHGGAAALSVNITSQTSPAQASWHVQIASSSFDIIKDHQYTVSFWIMSPTGGSKYQLEFRNTSSDVNYSGDQNTPATWSQESYSFTADQTISGALIAFDMGNSPNGSTFIDDVSVIDATEAAANSAPTAIAERVDSVLKLWITGAVTHYAGKVKAWDVVNEPMADGTSGLRTSTNTTKNPGETDYFFWSDYLGRSFALKAFEYAHAADPNALLFINEYGLESNTAKLDSLLNYVKELQAAGAHIDGIGTEMHTAWNVSPNGVDNMFQKLAATGLKIRISELDVSINPFTKPGISLSPTPLLFGYQAATYKYIVSSYLKYVPKEQRYGITIWGVDDPDSWKYNNGNDFPLLFDKNFAKKPAYAGVLQGLLGQ